MSEHEEGCICASCRKKKWDREARQVQSKYARLICEHCRGDGWHARDEMESCIRCQGTGFHPRIAHPAAAEIVRLRNRVEELEGLVRDNSQGVHTEIS